MNVREYQFLRAELGALEHMLDRLPESRVIERMGLESRKQDIQEELAAQPTLTRQPVQATLTFRGKPVAGSYGVFADFASTAVNAFSKVVASVGASGDRPLGRRGQLPNQDDFRLLITDTARGSFGFQLEEAAQEDMSLFPADSPLESALAQTQAILRATLASDEVLSEEVADTDPRALEALRKFLDELSAAEAYCALEFRDDVFRYPDVAELRRAAARLAQDNIHEDSQSLLGVFLGILPERRRFEFRVRDSGDVIAGKIGKDIDDPSQINRILDRPVEITVASRSVGQGTPRYTLVSYTPLPAGERDGDPKSPHE